MGQDIIIKQSMLRGYMSELKRLFLARLPVLLKRKLFSSIRRQYKVLRFGVLFIVIVVFLHINLVTPGRYTGNKPWGLAPKCKNSEEEIEQLVQLTYKVHSILERMGVESWLMYGSIWGPLRGIEGPLPWDDDVDLAINGEGKFSETTFEDFKALFVALGLSVESRLWQSSLIVVSEKDRPWPTLDLFVFYDYNGMMGRPGVESRLMPINYKLYHTFPSILVEPPLPKVKFGFFNISVPRNGMEIMKHLYPYNWWKVVKPAGCQD
ncbi:uncharacterized protein LOC144661421 isoform X3 [Oculina patagonica]